MFVYKNKNLNFKTSERKQVGILYHYTSIYSAFEITYQNKLISNVKYGVSLTRNKDFHRGKNRYINGMDVSFVLDGDLLSDKYKIYSFQDLDAKKDVELEKLIWEKEQEERINKDILNLNKYIIGVRFHMTSDDSESLEEYFKKKRSLEYYERGKFTYLKIPTDTPTYLSDLEYWFNDYGIKVIK